MKLRTVVERKKDVLAALEGHHDLWVATADAKGQPHLIAASSWWDGAFIVVATRVESRTAHNLAETGLAKLGHGMPADVILIDAKLENSTAAGQADDELAGGFSKAVGWDPREVGDDWAFYRLRPGRIQAYRGYEEIEGRDVMKGGRWLA